MEEEKERMGSAVAWWRKEEMACFGSSLDEEVEIRRRERIEVNKGRFPGQGG